MKDQILKLIHEENLTSAKFADKIGVQASSISHILSGRNKPSFDFIQKILLAFPAINTDWLLFGKGSMYKTVRQATLFDENNFVNQKTFKKEETIPIFNEIPIKEPEKTVIEPSKNFIQSEIVNELAKNNDHVNKIVIFYSDKTFSEYKPR